MLFIEGVDVEIKSNTAQSRLNQLSEMEYLKPSDEFNIHMATLELDCFEVVIYGEILVNELKEFLYKKAVERSKQLMEHSQSAEQTL